MTLEDELDILLTMDMSMVALEVTEFHPDENATKAGNTAGFDKPLEATSNPCEGWTKKLAFADCSIILALPLTMFMPLSRKYNVTPSIKLYDRARIWVSELRVKDANGPAMTVTTVASSKLNVDTKELPAISPTE
jgi:hypothetical protein